MPQLDAIENLPETKFLVERLGSPTLAQLVVHLHRELPSAWAFTGSVAMNIHAAHIDGCKIRDFQDADIQIDDTAFASFERKQVTAGSDALFTRPPRDDSGDFHYGFNGMPIDFVKDKRGTLPALSERQMIAGIPVLSLAALKQRKEADCNHGLDEARAAKARRDVPLLQALITRSQQAQAASTAAAANPEPAAPGAKRKRDDVAAPELTQPTGARGRGVLERR